MLTVVFVLPVERLCLLRVHHIQGNCYPILR